MDGPKVWEFHTARELEKYLLGNNVYELLARSRLIANEMICKCGLRMHLQNMRWDFAGAIVRFETRLLLFTVPFQWRCSGACKNGYHQTFRVFPEFKSWFWYLDRDVRAGTVLKQVVLLARDGLNADGPNYWKKLLEQYEELLKYVSFVRIRLFT